jgi:DNA repair exonuclease SbcCD ATPase subunit
MSDARTDSGQPARAPIVLRVEIESLGDELSGLLAREVAAAGGLREGQPAELAEREADLATAESRLLEREAALAREAAKLREEELTLSQAAQRERQLESRCEELERELDARQRELMAARTAATSAPHPDRRGRRAADLEAAYDERLSELEARETELEQRDAEREADLILREDRIEDRERELEDLEQRLGRKERELMSYVGQVQAALVSREVEWWERSTGSRNPIKH